MNLKDIESRRKEIRQSINQDSNAMREIIDETERVIDIAANAGEILNGIDDEFEKITFLNKTDSAFVFTIVMLQSIRWILAKEMKFPELNDRELAVVKEERLRSNEKNHKDGLYKGKSSGAFYEQEEIAKYREKHRYKDIESQEEFYRKKCKHRTWSEILMQPVPYDAMNALDKQYIPDIAGLNKKNKNGKYSNIYAKNHHVATLGHDPILGWIFGVANIMSSTISFVDFQNYGVIRGHKTKNYGFQASRELLPSDQVIDYSNPVALMDLLQECILSVEEDNKRIVAAVMKQAIHLESDKNCIEGLPIPILPIFNPEKAQELIEQGWNSVEFSKIMEEVLKYLKYDLKNLGISAIFNTLINMILATLYLYCLDTDDSLEIRKVKVAKILRIANVISSSSNILYVTVTKNIAKLDIVGIGSALIALFASEHFIGEMKREYIRNNFAAVVVGENCDIT